MDLIWTREGSSGLELELAMMGKRLKRIGRKGLSLDGVSVENENIRRMQRSGRNSTTNIRSHSKYRSGDKIGRIISPP